MHQQENCAFIRHIIQYSKLFHNQHGIYGRAAGERNILAIISQGGDLAHPIYSGLDILWFVLNTP